MRKIKERERERERKDCERGGEGWMCTPFFFTCDEGVEAEGAGASRDA